MTKTMKKPHGLSEASLQAGHTGHDAPERSRQAYTKPTLAKRSVHEVTLLTGGGTAAATGGLIAAQM